MAITKTEKVPAKKTATRKTTKKTAAKKAIRRPRSASCSLSTSLPRAECRVGMAADARAHPRNQEPARFARGRRNAAACPRCSSHRRGPRGGGRPSPMPSSTIQSGSCPWPVANPNHPRYTARLTVPMAWGGATSCGDVDRPSATAVSLSV